VIEVRPSTSDDVARFFPDPLPWRIRAMTMLKDGVIVGIGGLAYLPDEAIGMFAKLTDEARKARISLHRAGLAMMGEVRMLGFERVVAMADPQEPAAERWIKRFGFEPRLIEGKTVWVWEKD
jgi:hypothetical protein